MRNLYSYFEAGAQKGLFLQTRYFYDFALKILFELAAASGWLIFMLWRGPVPDVDGYCPFKYSDYCGI